MRLPVPNPQNPKWLLVIFLFFFSPSFSETTLLCGSSNQDSIPNFIPNLIVAMREVSKGVSESKYAFHSVISPDPSIFTYAQCFNFLSQNDCIACHSESRTELPRCLPASSARIYLDGCFLRYDVYKFYDEAIDKGNDMVRCGGPGNVTIDQYIRQEFKERVLGVVQRVVMIALKSKGFAVYEDAEDGNPVYAMAQCWATQSIRNCSNCLSNAARKVSTCAPATDGRVMNAGCYLRYSTENFLRSDTMIKGSGKSKLISHCIFFFFFWVIQDSSLYLKFLILFFTWGWGSLFL